MEDETFYISSGPPESGLHLLLFDHTPSTSYSKIWQIGTRVQYRNNPRFGSGSFLFTEKVTPTFSPLQWVRSRTPNETESRPSLENGTKRNTRLLSPVTLPVTILTDTPTTTIPSRRLVPIPIADSCARGRMTSPSFRRPTSPNIFTEGGWDDPNGLSETHTLPLLLIAIRPLIFLVVVHSFSSFFLSPLSPILLPSDPVFLFPKRTRSRNERFEDPSCVHS